MAHEKNKNSNRLHASRTRIKLSNLAQAKRTDRKIFDAARRTILTTIIATMLIVILAVLLTQFSSPERVVKQKITDIVADYYENYYYPQLVGTANQDTSLDQIMSHYTKSGFARITLRQLLLFDNERYAKSADTITTYCDEDSTFVQIFPESPFGKSDYRIDYHYSCTF